MNIKKGDTVKVLYGKDAGKQGKVISVFAKLDKVVVDGLNEFKKHVKGDNREKKSEIVTVVKPMPVAKVMLVCPGCGKPTRVGIKMENGKRVRFCKKCGMILDNIEVKEAKAPKAKSSNEEKESKVKKVVKNKVKKETKKE